MLVVCMFVGRRDGAGVFDDDGGRASCYCRDYARLRVGAKFLVLWCWGCGRYWEGWGSGFLVCCMRLWGVVLESCVGSIFVADVLGAVFCVCGFGEL